MTKKIIIYASSLFLIWVVAFITWLLGDSKLAIAILMFNAVVYYYFLFDSMNKKQGDDTDDLQ